MPTHDSSLEPAREVEQLREALDRQPVIEQAKGMLTLVYLLSDGAFELLRTISQHSNVKLFHTAAIIVAAAARYLRCHGVMVTCAPPV